MVLLPSPVKISTSTGFRKKLQFKEEGRCIRSLRGSHRCSFFASFTAHEGCWRNLKVTKCEPGSARPARTTSFTKVTPPRCGAFLGKNSTSASVNHPDPACGGPTTARSPLPATSSVSWAPAWGPTRGAGGCPGSAPAPGAAPRRPARRDPQRRGATAVLRASAGPGRAGLTAPRRAGRRGRAGPGREGQEGPGRAGRPPSGAIRAAAARPRARPI